MDQFDEHGKTHDETQASPGDDFELAPGLFASPMAHPPRRSSLEPIKLPATAGGVDHAAKPGASSRNLAGLPVLSPTSPRDQAGTALPHGAPLARTFSSSRSLSSELKSPRDASLPGLPEPDPEPDLPFDFHRFLEQLRHRTADPVAKFLRSFLTEFGKKQWMVHEQVKIISDFLVFITERMAQCDVWADVSDAEFDNAREGMEKLVMNRLYSQTFSPAIPPPRPLPQPKGKRRVGDRPMAPGRRGQHQEDIERDDVLAQKVKIYGWVREEHLDIKPVGAGGRRFLALAQQGASRDRKHRISRS